ncbi:uncharacterized protein [Chelonus insularis]|uniref:uncharacterized protein isoform X2 n=1 Tax=Chelonus insularis TaxID=460826 RepID=UPI00158A79D3|nr:uncharacterized protein LOC118069052 isoform X2 [Chelonus insularis]
MQKRGPMWLKKETRAMLNIIKDNNLLKRSLSDSELVQILVKLMKERGYERTPLQIRMKLKTLERNYFLCKRRTFDTAALKQFSHYNILNELYSRKRKRDNEESDGGIISDYNDDNSNIWLAEEIQKMMSIIEESNLASDLSDGFTLFALRIISEELMKAGYEKDVEQVETALTSLKMTYRKTQEALKNDIDTEVCPYFDSLQKIWGTDTRMENRNNNLIMEDMSESEKISPDNSQMLVDTSKSDDEHIEKRNGHLSGSVSSINLKNGDSLCSKWSEDETLALLSVIEETDVFDDFIHNLSTSTTTKLMEAFNKRGYNRTVEDVTKKLRYLRDTYLRSLLNGSNKSENSQYNNKIDNMIVIKKVNVDKALQNFDTEYNIDHKIRSDHNYMSLAKKKLHEKLGLTPSEYSGDNEFQPDPYDSDVKIVEEIRPAQENIKKNHFQNNVSSSTENNASSKQKTNFLITTPILIAKPIHPSEIDSKDKIKTSPGVIVERISSSQPPGLVFIPPITTSATTQNVNCTPQTTIASSAASSSQKTTTKPQTIPLKTKINIPIIHNPQKVAIPIAEYSTKTIPITNAIPVNSETSKSTLESIFKHEEQLQQQHQKWMEQQFEIQRKYDRDQRAVLLHELRELKKVFIQAIAKNNFISNSKS